MLRLAFSFILTGFALFAAPLAVAEPDPFRSSGLPVPRFVTLKSDEINVRTGPGMRYPILWQYRREGLPVEIIDEFENWRRIRDFEGAEGWVNQVLLSGRRSVIIDADTPVIVRRRPRADSPPVVRLAPSHIAGLESCEAEWCAISSEGFEGWTQRKFLWGIYETEQIN